MALLGRQCRMVCLWQCTQRSKLRAICCNVQGLAANNAFVAIIALQHVCHRAGKASQPIPTFGLLCIGCQLPCRFLGLGMCVCCQAHSPMSIGAGPGASRLRLQSRAEQWGIAKSCAEKLTRGAGHWCQGPLSSSNQIFAHQQQQLSQHAA